MNRAEGNRDCTSPSRKTAGLKTLRASRVNAAVTSHIRHHGEGEIARATGTHGNSLRKTARGLRFYCLSGSFLKCSFRFSLRVSVQCRLSRGQSRHRNAIWRTAHVVQSDLVAERDRTWITTVLATDSHFEIGFYAASALSADAHKFADTFTVQNLERIVGQNLTINIAGEKSSRVIATQSKG